MDRILNQQKAEREARESARRAAEREAAQMRPPGAFIDDTPADVPGNGGPPPLPPNKPGSEVAPPSDGLEKTAPPVPEKGGKSLLNSMKNKINGRNSGEDPMGTGLRSGLERLMSSANRTSGGGGPLPGSSRKNGPGRDTDAQPTPESDISKLFLFVYSY